MSSRPQRERLLDGAMRGMVSELDPHSSYMNPKEFDEFQSDTEGKFAGIGIEVEMRDDYVTVLAPIAGSPAARAGLQPGDKIVAVDRKPLHGLKPALRAIGTYVNTSAFPGGEIRANPAATLIFADGFEFGGTGDWSATVP